MGLLIEYLDEIAKGTITASEDISTSCWNRIRELVIGIQPEVEITDKKVLSDWGTILTIAPHLAYLKKEYKFKVSYNESAKTLLIRYRDEVQAVRAASGTQKILLNENDIPQQLIEKRFTKRSLKPYQLRDVAIMAQLSNGANFSVPGAGKTTVAFATHIITRSEDTRLLVVAPKNAFSAWDDVIKDCMDSNIYDQWVFTRLVGGNNNIQELLKNNPMRMIIGYEQLIKVQNQIFELLSTNKVHVILDESHRMKAGDRSQRGATLLGVSHLPVRRDILSGTPIPRSIEDIGPQLEFLWPGQSLDKRVKDASSPRQILNGLYVRTTKQELGLLRPKRHFIPVKMSPSQVALYSIIRQEVLKQLSGIRTLSNIDLTTAKRSVMRLLQVSSNPVMVVRRLTEEDPYNFNYDDPKIESIFKSILEEKDSPKLKEACQLARQIVKERGKVVIWSTFRENVERIAFLLSDLGATFIHGQVDTGDENDPNTREGRIKMFHDKNNKCNVLVANPAACSEGISLHTVCHDAIYLDRSYNAAHYLQSVDRIHRLGLPPGTETNIYVLESVAPSSIGAIDYSVRRRLISKLRTMFDALEDIDLQTLAIDEEEGEIPVDYDVSLADLADIIDELSGSSHPPEDEEVY
jgi:SNF2 family DNA or RNA helicase